MDKIDFVQMFKCCMSTDSSHQGPPRRRIDRSMIGHPTNFIHTSHLGTNDLMTTSQAPTQFSAMASKGGYGMGFASSHSSVPSSTYQDLHRRN